MTIIDQRYLPHVLCVLIIISRLGDVVSTFIASRSLRLESNPISRRYGWPFIITLSILLPFLPYITIKGAAVVIVVSFWCSADNTSRIWLIRAVGEKEYSDFMSHAISRSSLRHGLICVYLKSFFIAAIGFSVILLCSESTDDLIFWFGVGIISVAISNATTSTFTLRSRFNKVTSTEQDPQKHKHEDS